MPWGGMSRKGGKDSRLVGSGRDQRMPTGSLRAERAAEPTVDKWKLRRRV